MKESGLKKFITPVIGILAIAFMIGDFINYPPLSESEPGWEFKNNYEGSLSKHVLLVLTSLFLEKILYYQVRLRSYFFILFCIYLINLIWAFSNMIHNGGIAVIYSIWSIFILIYVIVVSIQEIRKK